MLRVSAGPRHKPSEVLLDLRRAVVEPRDVVDDETRPAGRKERGDRPEERRDKLRAVEDLGAHNDVEAAHRRVVREPVEDDGLGVCWR